LPATTKLVEQRLTSHSTQFRSFRRQPKKWQHKNTGQGYHHEI